MKNTDYEILSLFKGNPDIELTTSKISQKIYHSDFIELNKTINDENISNDSKKKAKLKIGLLQRRILHHLSKLVKEEILIISKIEGKGQKSYSLKIKEGEEITIDKYKRKIIITKNPTPALPLGDSLNKKITYKVESETFFTNTNAILIESDKFKNTKEAFDFTYNLFSIVNDVIGFNDFEQIIQKFSYEEVKILLDKLEEESEAYDKRISCIIDISNIYENSKTNFFFDNFLKKPKKYINFVFDTTSREILSNADLFEILITKYAKNKKKLNIKNEGIHNAPYFVGKSGPYCFEKKEWKNYVDNFQKNNLGIICSESTIILDLFKFYKEKNNSAKDLKNILLKITKSLFYSNTYQKKNSSEYHQKLKFKENKNHKDYQIFNYSKNYIRLWNYESKIEDFNLLIELLKDIKESINEFSKTQEAIYISCGMPTNFNIGISTAFKRFNEDDPLATNFEEIKINKTKDLFSKEIKEKLNNYEKIRKIFNGGSEARFFRSGEIDVLEIIREFNTISNTYSIPFFCYNFSKPVGTDMTLKSFM